MLCYIITRIWNFIAWRVYLAANVRLSCERNVVYQLLRTSLWISLISKHALLQVEPTTSRCRQSRRMKPRLRQRPSIAQYLYVLWTSPSTTPRSRRLLSGFIGHLPTAAPNSTSTRSHWQVIDASPLWRAIARTSVAGSSRTSSLARPTRLSSRPSPGKFPVGPPAKTSRWVCIFYIFFFSLLSAELFFESRGVFD